MSYSYDLTTQIGQVRLLVPDHDESLILMQDEEIQAMINIEYGFVKRAAAQCLETIASNRALVLQVIRTNDLMTDGAKLSTELRARAKDLREQADREEAYNPDGAFDVAEMVTGNFSYRERLWDTIMRQQDNG